MKKISVLLSAMLLITSASYAQKRETRDVSIFTKIAFRTAGKVYVKQGTPQKVEIEGTSDILEKIKTKVEDGRLVIGPENSWRNWNWGSEDKVTVYITVANIEALDVSGSGELIAQTKITGNNINLDVSGSGSLTAELEAQDVDSDVSGSGRVSVNGTIAGKADFEISGSGKVLGADLVTNVARIDIAGSGDVEITVNKDLDADITGSGTVRYKGNPARVNSDASGSGSVKKM